MHLETSRAQYYQDYKRSFISFWPKQDPCQEKSVNYLPLKNRSQNRHIKKSKFELMHKSLDEKNRARAPKPSSYTKPSPIYPQLCPCLIKFKWFSLREPTENKIMLQLTGSSIKINQQWCNTKIVEKRFIKIY